MGEVSIAHHPLFRRSTRAFCSSVAVAIAPRLGISDEFAGDADDASCIHHKVLQVQHAADVGPRLPCHRRR